MNSGETPSSEPDNPIRKANTTFYEKTKLAFQDLFDCAKAKNELQFAFSLAPEFRGMQDAGWNTALEAQVAFQQYLQFIQANPDDAFKARVALAFYSHLAEAGGFYEVPKNMLRVAGGERYNVWPFLKLVEKLKLTGALIWRFERHPVARNTRRGRTTFSHGLLAEASYGMTTTRKPV